MQTFFDALPLGRKDVDHLMTYNVFAHLPIYGLEDLGFAACGEARQIIVAEIGALVRVSVRRINIEMASACPYQNEFAIAHSRLTAAAR
jgi:hypothetical protein